MKVHFSTFSIHSDIPFVAYNGFPPICPIMVIAASLPSIILEIDRDALTDVAIKVNFEVEPLSIFNVLSGIDTFRKYLANASIILYKNFKLNSVFAA